MSGFAPARRAGPVCRPGVAPQVGLAQTDGVMPSVSEAIVREFFEIHGFRVRQPRKHLHRSLREQDEADFLVLNPHPSIVSEPLPFILEPEHLSGLARGLVVVKGYHTDTFSPGRLTQRTSIFRFVSGNVVKQAVRELGDGPPVTRILVVPALPQDDEARRKSVEVMRANGVDAALSFPTILADLFRRVEVNRDYQKSDLLQILRILKNYGLLRDPQLELFKSARTRRTAGSN